MKYKRKGSLLACYVLHALMDGKIHTLWNIADKICKTRIKILKKYSERIRSIFLMDSIIFHPIDKIDLRLFPNYRMKKLLQHNESDCTKFKTKIARNFESK